MLRRRAPSTVSALSVRPRRRARSRCRAPPRRQRRARSSASSSSMSSATPAPCPAARDHVGGLLEAGQRVGDRDRAPAERQEGVVVLRVADADDVVRRQTQLVERGGQARRLVDAGRQHHDGALVEDDLQLQAQLADRLEHRRPRAAPDVATITAPTRQRRHAARRQPLRRTPPAPGGPSSRSSRVGRPQKQRAVLGDDARRRSTSRGRPVPGRRARGRSPARAPAAGPQARQRVARRRRQHAAFGDGAVVVAGEGEVAHWSSYIPPASWPAFVTSQGWS